MVRFLSRIAGFAGDRRGNVAMIFALALIPVALLGGGAVDLSQAMNARSRLAQALDAAALAVGVSDTMSDAAALQIANDFIGANYPDRELGTVSNVSISLDDANDSVIVRGQARVKTTILGLIGLEHLTVHWESEVQRARQRLELVMVLDNTGSMRGSKIRSLRNSAELLTDMLFEVADTPGDVNIGLVPFAATVNVGTQYERAWWLDPDARSAQHAEWYHGSQSVNHWDLFDQFRNERWDGCVEARAMPMDIDDTPPDPGSPDSLFVPYFAPDEPDIGHYSNSYLNDGTRGGVRTRLQNLDKYDRAYARRGGPNRGCTTTPVTPLTSSRSTINRAIGDMDASGYTNIPNGIGWGVRVLSPAEPFTGGAEFDDREVVKALVILTDGDNVLSGTNTDQMSDYEAYGFIENGRLGVRSSSHRVLARALDERTVAACEYANSLGLRVYTITFQVSSSDTRDLMRDCASNPSLYFDSPSAEALEDAFEMIAGDLTNLRLSR